ncbi:MAG: transcriptional regulator NrdR [Thermoguttaceae bacterium]|nr:transcriptional regulator NrdR [Thermoguttaceae bacterium]
MRCPYCDVDNDRVLDSRASEDGGAIRRRRECLSCHERYTTYERVERSAPRVIKKDGTRVPFDRMKIQQGIERACWKLPVDESQVDTIVREIEVVLENRNDPEITSQEIGELVMEYLRELNQVAYIRFASVYRAYRNIRDFVQELQPMLEEFKSDSTIAPHPPTSYRK